MKNPLIKEKELIQLIIKQIKYKIWGINKTNFIIFILKAGIKLFIKIGNLKIKRIGKIIVHNKNIEGIKYDNSKEFPPNFLTK